jgi:hypothetical protein
MNSARRHLAQALALAVLLAGCSGDSTSPNVNPVTSSLRCQQPDGSYVSCDLILAQDGGFTLQLTSRECLAVGDSVKLTKPETAVLSGDACKEPLNRTWTFNGPYTAGTAIGMQFVSGFNNGVNVAGDSTGVHVTGQYPDWTINYEDGGGAPWFQGLVLIVHAF